MEFSAVNRRRPSRETPLGPGAKKDGCFRRLAKREFTPAILFLFGLCIIHSEGGKQCSLARDSEPMRLLKTPRSLSVYILILRLSLTSLTLFVI